MYNFRTDLADERVKISGDVKGIETREEKITDNINVSTVEVIDEEGSKKIDKKIGTYTTINIKDLEIITNEDLKLAREIFTRELNKILKIDGPILVVGLGNEELSADSIGPKVIKDLEITRHILKYKPDLLKAGTREVMAISPGVLGTTGIETSEIIKGIIQNVDVSGIIVIDALCSNNISRLLRTIQISDTGITPGAGVYNKRKELSKETLGIPVIAIGVPTLVEAATIVADTFDIFTEEFDEFSFLKDSSHQDKYKLIKTVLEPAHYNLAVMPKEIDELIDNMKEIISNGINQALNP